MSVEFYELAQVHIYGSTSECGRIVYYQKWGNLVNPDYKDFMKNMDQELFKEYLQFVCQKCEWILKILAEKKGVIFIQIYIH